MRLKRGLALFSAFFLLLLYGISIFCAFLNSPLAQSMLLASIFCSICLPAVLYGYLLLLRLRQGQPTHLEEERADSANDKTEATRTNTASREHRTDRSKTKPEKHAKRDENTL